jgi:hypothetical protein
MKNIDGVKSFPSLSEADLQIMLAQYIRLHYPDILFHSDFGSGVKLTAGQAVRQSKQNGGRRAWPDLFIAAPTDLFHGLFIELKRYGTRLKKKNGDWATVHIAEQAEVLGQLRERGYEAVFACGFDQAREIIDKYVELHHKFVN